MIAFMTIDAKFFLNSCITIFSIEMWDFHSLRHSIDAEASGDHFEPLFSLIENFGSNLNIIS